MRQKNPYARDVLSAKSSVDDRVRGLQAGGDDYLVKPFSFFELLARVHALIRRANHETEPTRLLLVELSLDLLRREVARAGKIFRSQQCATRRAIQAQLAQYRSMAEAGGTQGIENIVNQQGRPSQRDLFLSGLSVPTMRQYF